MVRIPNALPGVGADVYRANPARGPGVVQQEDHTGEQIEDLGSGFVRAGGAIADFQEREREARAKGRTSRHAEDNATIFTDHDTGYDYARGKDAVDRHPQVLKQIEEAYQRALADADDDELDLVMPAAEARRREAIARANHRRETEGRTYLIGETAAQAQAFGNEYSQAKLDGQEERARARKVLALQEVDEHSHLMGWPLDGPQATAARLSATTAMHQQVLDRMVVDGRAADAAAYLEASRGEIDPEVLPRVQGAVERATTGLRASHLAGQIEARVMQRVTENRGTLSEPPAPSPLDPLHRLAEAGEMVNELVSNGSLSPAEAKATADVLQSNILRRAADEARVGRQSLDGALDMLRQNPLGGVTALSPVLQEDLARRGLLESARSFVSNGGAFRTSDPSLVAAALALPDETLRSLSADSVYVALRGRLSDPDLKVVMAKHAVANGVEVAKNSDTLTWNQELEEAAKVLNILPRTSTTTRTQADAFDRFRIEIDAELKKWEEVHKRPPTSEERTKLLDLKKNDRIKRAGGWFSADQEVPRRDVPALPPQRPGESDADFARRAKELFGPYFVEVGAERERVGLGDIPSNVQGGIAEFLSAIGKQPTFQNIADRWVEIGRPRN